MHTMFTSWQGDMTYAETVPSQLVPIEVQTDPTYVKQTMEVGLRYLILNRVWNLSYQGTKDKRVVLFSTDILA